MMYKINKNNQSVVKKISKNKMDDKFNLDGYTNDAKETLKVVTTDYVNEIIQETNRIEPITNKESKNKEITSNIVYIAKNTYKNTPIKETKKHVVFLELVTPIVAAIVGFMFDIELIREEGSELYFLIVAIIFTGVIISMTYTTFKGDK